MAQFENSKDGGVISGIGGARTIPIQVLISFTCRKPNMRCSSSAETSRGFFFSIYSDHNNITLNSLSHSTKDPITLTRVFPPEHHLYHMVGHDLRRQWRPPLKVTTLQASRSARATATKPIATRSIVGLRCTPSLSFFISRESPRFGICITEPHHSAPNRDWSYHLSAHSSLL